MQRDNGLPPGQQEIDVMPRFGLTKFARRFPGEPNEIAVDIGGDVGRSLRLSTEFSQLQGIDQVSDFHCVTTWTKRELNWSGFRFSDFYKHLVLEQAQPDADTTVVVFRAQDGYRVSMQLEDLLQADVMLADKLDGQPLPIAHGAPLRLIAPAHYGYKNAKHINKIEFWRDERHYQPSGYAFMDHPRARVASEERGRIFPGWLLRRLYRPSIESTIKDFQKALVEHLKKGSS